MAGSSGRHAGRLVALALVVACNSPSSGGPGLEPPGGNESPGPGFANDPNEAFPTGMTSGGGADSPPPGAAGGMDPSGGAAAATGGSLGGVDAGIRDAGDLDANHAGTRCDRRTVRCRAAEPVCPDGEVVEIIDGCFGACVSIDTCVCDEPAACPDSAHYTCHDFKERCGPYL